MLDQFNALNVDSRKATFSAISLLAIILLLCCISKWILYTLTAFSVIYAMFLGYKLFIEKKPTNKPVMKSGKVL